MYNTTTAENKFQDNGNFMQKGNVHMLSAVNSEAQKELLVQFAIGKELHSIDQKVILKLDTSMDVTYLNMKTFRTLFPDVELQSSNLILETCVRPLGTLKCFLRCKGRKYRINMEVMSKDHAPNVLLQETIGILKPCFMVSKKQSISDAIAQRVQKENHSSQMEGNHKNST